MNIIEIQNVQYAYDGKKKVLKGINAQMEQGRMYAILGPSGCGKTTLLSLLGGLDSPTSGQILYQGDDIAKTGLADHRRSHVAFIFQSYNFIDYLTPMENVALTSKLPPLPILEQLGLTAEEAKRNVLKLSGGQQQRVGVARALVVDPKIIFADEPTGNLDSNTSVEVMNLMKKVVREKQQTLVMVTHDMRSACRGNRILYLKDGMILGECDLGRYSHSDIKRHEKLSAFLKEMGW